jgi:hypothetical protein
MYCTNPEMITTAHCSQKFLAIVSLFTVGQISRCHFVPILYTLDSEQDTAGGTTRLSYAQVAQHHKEKVERMLRERQSSEQEKEKEKDRKKEGSTRVVQQHGDVRGWFFYKFAYKVHFIGSRTRDLPAYYSHRGSAALSARHPSICRWH